MLVLISLGLFEKPYLPNSFASIYLEPRYGLGGGLLSFTLKDNPDITALCGRFKVVSTGHRSVISSISTPSL